MSVFAELILVVLVALVYSAQHAACRAVPDASAQAARRALRAEQPAAAAQHKTIDVGSKIDGQYIVIFKRSAGEASSASQKLAASVQRTAAAAAAASPAGAAPTGFEVLNTLTISMSSSSSSSVAAGSGAAAAAADAGASSAAAAPRLAARSMQGIVVRASLGAVAHIRAASDLVQSVIQDRVVVSQQLLQEERPEPAVEAAAADNASAQQSAGCVELKAVAAGVSGRLSPAFKWPRCLVPGAQIVWSGRACGDGSKIQYTQMRAVDAATGETLKPGDTPCVVRFDAKRTNWSRQRFGGCGSRPLHVTHMPTVVCSATGGNPSNVAAPESPSPSPVDTQEPASPSPVPAGDESGSSNSNSPQPVGLDSQPAASPSPTPEASPASPSPAPLVRTGPLLPRVALLPGEAVPAGVARIEAVTTDGADDTAGLPAGQQVIVGVIDSGIDGSHPDINYAGGQSWADTSADSDGYGHGTHVAGIIGAKNNGQGVVGVSPGTRVYSLKVLDAKGRGSISNVLAAVKWVTTEGVKQGIRVINLSLATYVDPANTEEYAATRDAVCGVFAEAVEAGVFVATAAGNYGDKLRGYFPAACPSVATVTAVNEDGSAPADFSNFLAAADATAEDEAHVIAAPGTNIRSTISYARDASGYRSLSGTSMAAPHIAGVAANCMMAGACAPGTSGLATLATLQAAARERVMANAQYGFAGDATNTVNGKFFGLLAWAKW